MKKIFLLSFFGLFLISCGSSHKTTKNAHRDIIGNKSSNHTKVAKSENHRKPTRKIAEPTTEDLFGDGEDKAPFTVKQEIIDYAKTFQGTRYKFGGTTKAGMDCSGLICTAFQRENIDLPRVSRDMATKGVSVSLKNIEKGDLIFFKTSSRNTISHVGLVVEAKKGEVKFIHSTTSAGVIISSLDEAYWKKAFAEVRRVI